MGRGHRIRKQTTFFEIEDRPVREPTRRHQPEYEMARHPRAAKSAAIATMEIGSDTDASSASSKESTQRREKRAPSAEAARAGGKRSVQLDDDALVESSGSDAVGSSSDDSEGAVKAPTERDLRAPLANVVTKLIAGTHCSFDEPSGKVAKSGRGRSKSAANSQRDAVVRNALAIADGGMAGSHDPGHPASIDPNGAAPTLAALGDVTELAIDPSIDFSRVGGLPHHILALREMVVIPLLYPSVVSHLRLKPPSGVLFYGAPGTGKTLIARALCNEGKRLLGGGRRITFFMRKGADILSKWVGESERQLRLLFEEARRQQPSIIFFDEIDGLAPVRHSRQEQSNAALVSTLLALMDGLDERGQVIVIGATNRPDMIDPALRRPGRFDRELFFPLPDALARRQILSIHVHASVFKEGDGAMNELVQRTEKWSGADIAALAQEASLHALRRSIPILFTSSQRLVLDRKEVRHIRVTMQDMRSAVRRMLPTVLRSSVTGRGGLLGSAGQQQLQRLFGDDGVSAADEGAGGVSLLSAVAYHKGLPYLTRMAEVALKDLRDATIARLRAVWHPLQQLTGEHPPSPAAGESDGTPGKSTTLADSLQDALYESMLPESLVAPRPLFVSFSAAAPTMPFAAFSCGGSSEPADAVAVNGHPPTAYEDDTAEEESRATADAAWSIPRSEDAKQLALAVAAALPSVLPTTVYLDMFLTPSQTAAEGSDDERDDFCFSGGAADRDIDRVDQLNGHGRARALSGSRRGDANDSSLSPNRQTGQHAPIEATTHRPLTSPPLTEAHRQPSDNVSDAGGRRRGFPANTLKDSQSALLAIFGAAAEASRSTATCLLICGLSAVRRQADRASFTLLQHCFAKLQDSNVMVLIPLLDPSPSDHFTAQSLLQCGLLPITSDRCAVDVPLPSLAVLRRVVTTVLEETVTSVRPSALPNPALWKQYPVDERPVKPPKACRRATHETRLEQFQKIDYKRRQLRHILRTWISYFSGNVAYKKLFHPDLDLEGEELTQWRQHTKGNRICLGDVMERLDHEDYHCMSQYLEDIDLIVKNVNTFFRGMDQRSLSYRAKAKLLRETTILNNFRVNKKLLRFCELSKDEKSPADDSTDDEGEGDDDGRPSSASASSGDESAGGQEETKHEAEMSDSIAASAGAQAVAVPKKKRPRAWCGSGRRRRRRFQRLVTAASSQPVVTTASATETTSHSLVAGHAAPPAAAVTGEQPPQGEEVAAHPATVEIPPWVEEAAATGPPAVAIDGRSARIESGSSSCTAAFIQQVGAPVETSTRGRLDRLVASQWVGAGVHNVVAAESELASLLAALRAALHASPLPFAGIAWLAELALSRWWTSSQRRSAQHLGKESSSASPTGEESAPQRLVSAHLWRWLVRPMSSPPPAMTKGIEFGHSNIVQANNVTTSPTDKERSQMISVVSAKRPRGRCLDRNSDD